DGATQRRVCEDGEHPDGDGALGRQEPRRGGHREGGGAIAHLADADAGEMRERGHGDVALPPGEYLLHAGEVEEGTGEDVSPDGCLPGLDRRVHYGAVI